MSYRHLVIVYDTVIVDGRLIMRSTNKFMLYSNSNTKVSSNKQTCEGQVAWSCDILCIVKSVWYIVTTDNDKYK